MGRDTLYAILYLHLGCVPLIQEHGVDQTFLAYSMPPNPLPDYRQFYHSPADPTDDTMFAFAPSPPSQPLNPDSPTPSPPYSAIPATFSFPAPPASFFLWHTTPNLTLPTSLHLLSSHHHLLATRYLTPPTLHHLLTSCHLLLAGLRGWFVFMSFSL